MTSPSPKLGVPLQAGSDDASIPMLTERLTLPPLELDTTLPFDVPEEPPAAAPMLAPAPPPLPATAPAPVVAMASRVAADAAAAGAHWTRIELELRASILNQLAEALPQEVDAIVRSKMNDSIDRFVSQLAAETRLAMAASLHDIVDHAVRAELDRLRGRKR